MPIKRKLIAAALVALIALLVGFHGATAYLSAVTLSAQAERPVVANVVPRDDRVKPPAPTADMVKSPAPVVDTPASTPEVRMPASTGIAAAAKAKAQAELDALGPDEALDETPPARPRRTPRRPRVDLHRVY